MKAPRAGTHRTELSKEQIALRLNACGQHWKKAAAHALMTRRINTVSSDGVSIYNQKHHGLNPPPQWGFGAAVDFKPSNKQMVDANALPRGRTNSFVGYHVSRGGSWSGDFLCADLRDFETNSGKKRIRAYRTKTVIWNGESRPVYPLYEAKQKIRETNLIEGMQQKD